MVRAGSQEAAASAVTQSIRPLHAELQYCVAVPDNSCEGHCTAARTADDDSTSGRARMRAGVR